MKNIVEITDSQFDSEVLSANQPVLVDFHATWCGPCKMLAPLLEAMAVQYEGRVKFVKVDVDEAPELAQRYGITSIPTVILFQHREVADVMIGLPSPKKLQARLQQLAEEGAQSAPVPMADKPCCAQ